MTKRQEILYTAIKDYIDKNNYSPTLQELAELIGDNSRANVLAKLRNLRKKGLIDFQDNKSRTIVLKGE